MTMPDHIYLVHVSPSFTPTDDDGHEMEIDSGVLPH